MEINLVQQVELKLLLADTDAKFSSALATFLVPLIQKLASPNDEVVAKVSEILLFLQNRSAKADGVIFPTQKLLEKFEEHALDTSMRIVKQNMQLLNFLGLALEKNPIPIELDRLVLGMRNYNSKRLDIKSNTAEQFSLFLLVLNQHASKTDQSLHIVADVPKWDPSDLDVLSFKLAQLFLLDLRHYNLHNQPVLTPEETQLLVKHCSKLNIHYPLESELGLNSIRKSVMRLSQQYPEEFKYVLVAAMGDPMLEISRNAQSEVHKIKSFDYNLLQHWAMNGSVALRTEILDLMARNYYIKFDPHLILTCFALGDLKLRRLALQLLQSAVNDLNVQWDTRFDSQFYGILRQYIIDDGWPRSQVHSSLQTRLRQQCYELLGVFDMSQNTLKFLFQSLERDSSEMSSSIQKALMKILENGQEKLDASTLLGYIKRSQNQRIRYAAIRFAVQRLEPTDPLRLVICLLGIDPSQNRSDVVLESQKGLICKDISELPEFTTLFRCVEENIRLDEGTHEDLVNATLLTLLTCLVRWPPLSKQWYDELKTMILIKSSPLDEQLSFREEQIKQVAILMFKLVSLGNYYTIIPQILRRILPHIADPQNLFNTGLLLDVLGNPNNKYGTFVAETLAHLCPNLDIKGSNELQVLARAFIAAEAGTKLHDLNELVVRTKNFEALQVLAACGLIALNEDLKSFCKHNQLVLACLSIHSDKSERKVILESLLSLNYKGFDDIVANGEAITVVVSGWDSKVLQEKYPNLVHKNSSFNSKSWELEKVALEAVTSGIKGSPDSRRIACIRLLCLVQYSFNNADDLPAVAKGIHSCFMNLLCDSDDVTQESAGRGLGILFEINHQNKSLQNELLSDLLSSFSDDTAAKKHTAGTLTADTRVFEPGTLPSEPRGSTSISTYKDVMNLANETGDSSLVYKFMSLSSSSQIWTGRKGIAFSLEQILAKSELASQIFSGSDLGQRLIPKLFRYLYDPIAVTQAAMKNIWTMLIPSSKRSQVIKLYLPQIIKETYSGVISREWRIRQGSTAALADMVSQGLVEVTIDLWKAGFRAIDDIKESVRVTGSELLKTLTSSLVRANCQGQSSHLDEIFPFLLKGLGNDSTVKFSLETILKLSKTPGFKPWAAQVVEELILQLSSLEPQALNYFALNTNQHVVDEARAKGLIRSPIMQSIEAMVERNSPNSDELWQILPRIVKKSVGVSSKLAAARLITLSSLMSYGERKLATEQLLAASVNELWGNNDIICEHYASAMGYLCRNLPLSLTIRYVDILRTKFVNSGADDVRVRNTIGDALWSFSNNASDVFSAISSNTMPLVFVGTFTDESKNYKRVWETNTGGEASLRLYRTELIQFCCELLNNSSVRTLKVAAGQVLTHVLSVGDLLSNSDSLLVANALLTNLSGRSWPKKEHLFVALVACFPSIINEDTKMIVQERILNEVQRRNVEYKLGILPSVVKFLKRFSDSEIRDHKILREIMKNTIDGTIEVCSDDKDEKVRTCRAVFELGDLSVFTHALETGSWKYRFAACESLYDQPFREDIWEIVTNYCSNDENHEKVRLEWSRVAAKFKANAIVQQGIRSRVKVETSSLVLRELKNAM